MADDFATNGLFLPSREEAALTMRLPLHRGPHHAFSQLVEARLALIARGPRLHRYWCGRRRGACGICKPP